MELQEVKDFLRIDFDEDDNYIKLLIEQTNIYIKTSIDDFEDKILKEEFKNSVKLLQFFFIQDLYDNRTFVSNKNEKTKFIIDSMLLKLKL